MSINLTVEVENDKAIRQFRELQRVAKTSTSNIVSDTDRMDMAMRRLGTAIGSLGLGFSFSQLARQVANVRGEFQQLEVAFTTMLGSKAEADMLMSKTVDFAAKTPFDLQGVANGTKQLLAFGSEASEVTDEMRMLGDIAAGLSIPIGDLVYLYGTTRTQGRMFTMDLRQFMGRGIPLAEELAKQFGVTKNKVSELVTEGKVGFDDMQRALKSMTSEGGKFYNLMEEQSKTITGQMSNLEDSIQQMFNALGKESEGVITSAIQGASYLVENYEKVGRVLMDIVAAYGSYKAAVMIVNAVIKVRTALLAAETLALRANAIAHTNLTTATTLLAKSMKALNLTALANPYVLAGAAIAATTFGLYKWITAKSAEEKALDKVNGKIEEYVSSQKELSESAVKDAETMKDSNVSTLERIRAYNSLIEKYPELLNKYDEEAIKLMTIANLQKEIAEINSSRLMSNLAAQKEEITNMLNVINSRKKTGVDGNKTYANASDKGMAATLMAELDAVNKKIAEQIRLQEQAAFDSMSDDAKIKAYEQEIALIDELLASKDELHAAESRASLISQKSELNKRIETLKKSGKKDEEPVDEKAQKKIASERLKLQEEAHRAEIEAKKAQIKDKVELLEYEKEVELAAIRKRLMETTDAVQEAALVDLFGHTVSLYDSKISTALKEKQSKGIIESLSFSEFGETGIKDPTEIIKKRASENIPAINALFGDLRNKTSKELLDIADAAEAMMYALGSDPEKLEAVRRAIERLRDKSDELESPLKSIKDGLVGLFSSKPNSEAFEDSIGELSSGLEQMSEIVSMLDGAFTAFGAGEAMDGVKEGLNVAISMVDGLKKGAELGSAFGPIGAAAGAAVGAVSSLAQSIAQIHDKRNEKQIEDLQKQIETLESTYDELGRSIRTAYSTDASALIKQQNDLLEQQKALIEQQISEENDKKNTDDNRVREWEKQLTDIDNAIADNAEKAKEAIAGISFDSFRNSFYDSLSDMSKSSEDFAKDFETMLMKSILNALMAEKYDDRIRALYDKWNKAAEDGLSEQEVNELRKEQEQLSKDMLKDRDSLASVFGWDNEASGQNSTSRGFQAMSQDTGDELNGRFTDIQGKVTDIRSFVVEMMNTGKLHYLEAVNIRDIMIQLNGNVADIKLYTQVLPEMKEAISSMNKKLDNL